MDDLGLPRSTLQKAIKDLLPPELRIAGDATDLLVQCCNQFVHMISTQANEVSEREKRSTISPEHVVKALEELEFGGQYVDAVKAAWEEWKVDNKEHHKHATKKGGAHDSGLTQQQLIELQQKLFMEARAATLCAPVPAVAADQTATAAAVAAAPAALGQSAAEQQAHQQQAAGSSGQAAAQQQQQSAADDDDALHDDDDDDLISDEAE